MKCSCDKTEVAHASPPFCTAEEVAQAFEADLKALLGKYNAELGVKWYMGHGRGRARITARIAAIYDTDHNCLQEHSEVDLETRIDVMETHDSAIVRRVAWCAMAIAVIQIGMGVVLLLRMVTG